MKKQVSVLVGAGSIGQAIIRRVSAGKLIVLADFSIENAQRAAKTLEDAGFECATIKCDLGSKKDILKLVEFATSKGIVTNVVNAAGVSPSQAPVEEILRVDLYGTSVLLEEFGKVIAEDGSGVIISSQSGHRLSALPQEQNDAIPEGNQRHAKSLSILEALQCASRDVRGYPLGTTRRYHQLYFPGHHHHALGQRRTSWSTQGWLPEDDRGDARPSSRNA